MVVELEYPEAGGLRTVSHVAPWDEIYERLLPWVVPPEGSTREGLDVASVYGREVAQGRRMSGQIAGRM